MNDTFGAMISHHERAVVLADLSSRALGRYGQQSLTTEVFMAGQIPLVDYLVLDDGEPHLVAQECTNCGARFFDRRNACANCFATEFKTVPIATEGTVRAFTIVTFAAPGIPTPFVAVGGRLRTAPRCAPTSSTSSPIPSTSATG